MVQKVSSSQSQTVYHSTTPGCGDSYRCLSYNFRVAPNTISLSINEVCDAIKVEFAAEVIQCPTAKEEWTAIADQSCDAFVTTFKRIIFTIRCPVPIAWPLRALRVNYLVKICIFEMTLCVDRMPLRDLQQESCLDWIRLRDLLQESYLLRMLIGCRPILGPSSHEIQNSILVCPCGVNFRTV